MESIIDICQCKAMTNMNDLNIISCIAWFEGGERSVYLLDGNGRYSWVGIPRDRVQIICQQQGRYQLHLEKIPPIVFVKPVEKENREQILAMAECMFLQCPEATELPIVNADGVIVAVARLKRIDDNEKYEWDKLKADGVLLPNVTIYVSSLASPHLAEFFHAFEDTGRVILLTNSNIDEVLSQKHPGLVLYDENIFGDNINKISVRNLYDELCSKRKIKDVAICGNGVYVRLVADNIIKYFPELRVLKKIDMDKEVFDSNTVKLLLAEGVQGCIAASSSNSNYEKLVEDLSEAHMPLIDPYEGKMKLDTKKNANKTYTINDGHYPVYVLSEVFGIPNLTFNPEWTLSIYDKTGNMYDCSLSYLWTKIPSIWNYLAPLDKKDEEIEIDVACYACESISLNYWHFNFQVMNRIFAMEESGFQGKYIVCDMPHIREIVQILGLTEQRMVWLQNKDNIRYKIHELHYVKFYENAKETTCTGIAVMQKYAMAILQRNAIGVDVSKYPKRIYVKRIGKRKLLGVDKILEEFGFYTIIPEEHSILEEILYFYAADVVLIPHGAGTANSIYMHKDATLIETFDRAYVNPCCSSYLLTLDNQVKYRMIVSRGTGRTGGHNDDYSVSEDLLRLTLLEVCGNKSDMN